MTTPGPWASCPCEETDIGGTTITHHNISSPRSDTIANVWTEDDARLIAAAPDMLEALKEIHAAMTARAAENGIGTFPTDAEIERLVRAVIAKAERE